MTIFVDTSAFYAVMDRDDAKHRHAATVWRRIVREDLRAVSSNYVYLESMALIQNRLGMEAARVFHNDVYGLIHTEWIDGGLHLAAVARLFAASKRKLSLVDCSSFEIMGRLKIADAFAFDRHFKENGFRLL